MAKSVSLGFIAPRGFATGDLTSPLRAAAADALVDIVLDRDDPKALPITELRVHGVSGSNGPTMLEHPTVLQVAGDTVTMFLRRWSPSGDVRGVGVRWKLEAYSWGGLTERPLASAAWLLLAPFMFYNLGHFSLPPTPNRELEEGERRLHRDRAHAVAQALLRMLAVTATVEFMVAVIAVLVNTVALQAGVDEGYFRGHANWFVRWTTQERVGLALGLVAIVLAVLWWISVKTANLYEARVDIASAKARKNSPLTQPGFWKGQELVRRQRSLHAAAVFAATALVISRPVADADRYRVIVAVGASLVLLLVLVSVCLPFADRRTVSLGATGVSTAPTAGTRWCWAMVVLGAVFFVASAFTTGWPGRRIDRPIPLPGFTNFAVFLFLAQCILLLALSAVVGFLVRRAKLKDMDIHWRPFVRGHLTTVLAVLAVCLGGVFGVVINVSAGRLLGTPVPGGTEEYSTMDHTLTVPWSIYAFAAAPIGVLVAAVIAAGLVGWRFHRNRCSFDPASTVQTPSITGDYRIASNAQGYARRRKSVARAWAVGRLTDQAGPVAVLCAGGMAAGTVLGGVAAAVNKNRGTTLQTWVDRVTNAESVLAILLAIALVALLRSDFSNLAKRKTIGALWDVATFWPRAAHPFAPPCYAERAIPELVDRIRILTGTVDTNKDDPAYRQLQTYEGDDPPGLTVPAGPVLLTGYSQGAVIAPAVIAQLPEDTRRKVALLTLACPARSLYARAFPGYLGQPQIDDLKKLLAGNGSLRWKNLVRRTDFIGSWIDNSPTASGPAVALDQLSSDPVALAADLDPTAPPIHRHSDWWADPGVTVLGGQLAGLLGARDPAETGDPDPAKAGAGHGANTGPQTGQPLDR